jgi:hypothetical protein
MQDQTICYEELRPALVTTDACAQGKKDILSRRGGLELQLGFESAFDPSAELSRARAPAAPPVWKSGAPKKKLYFART